MLAAHLHKLTRREPIRYAIDPSHEAVIRNYLSLMTRAQDLPSITHELTRRRLIPGDVSGQLMQALRNPAHPADLAMGADMLEESGLSGKIPTPGRAYGGFDAPHQDSGLLDQLFYHLHGLAQQGLAAMANERHPILREFSPGGIPAGRSDMRERNRIFATASSSMGRILRALPLNHPLRAPIEALYSHGSGRDTENHADMLRQGYDLSHQAEMLGQQHGGGYTRTEDSLGDLDWTGEHARREMTHGLRKLIDHLQGVRLDHRGMV